MRKISILLVIALFAITLSTVQPVNAGVNYILIDFELDTPSHYDPDWEVPCYRFISNGNPMPALDRLNLYVQPVVHFPSHAIFSDPSQEVALYFNFGRNDVQYSEKSGIFFLPGFQFVALEDIYRGDYPQGVAVLYDGMPDDAGNPINFSSVTSFTMFINMCYVPFADWENIELTITTGISGEGFQDWLNGTGHFSQFPRAVQIIEGEPQQAAYDMDIGWLTAFFSIFGVLFAVELLPGLRLGFLVAVPIIFSVFFWFLKIARK